MTNNTEMEKYFFRATAEDFEQIPGSPIAYWVNEKVRSLFEQHPNLFNFGETREGLTTGSNNLFLRFWYEVDRENIGLGFDSRESARNSNLDWFPYNKGGDVVKWYGNAEYIVNWHNDGEVLQTRKHPSGRIWAHNFNLDYIFKESISWTAISNKGLGFRYFPIGFLFDANGLSFFSNDSEALLGLISSLNSRVGEYFAKIINSSMKFNAGDIGRIPINKCFLNGSEVIAKKAISVTKLIWDSYETSWDFTTLPLLASEHHRATLAETYQSLRQHWQETTLEMQRLEEENNRIFIDAYGLQDELTPDVPLKEITLTCNPYYRYGKDAEQKDKNYPLDAKLEERLRLDTIAEFISYAVGCLFGRYSLDMPGLILANQGDGLKEYLAQVPNPSFEVDDDNVIPILDADWFSDDIVERFKKFLQITFGEQNLDESLTFVEKALGKDIRSYFVKDFYTDHVKRYKKRPIYWMFSSPKGSFNALIYMHRYRTDTVSVVLNEYLREFRSKLEAQVKYQETVQASVSASQRDKTKALKEIDRLKKVLVELDDYERDTLYPLATQQIAIDLDDGVKVNYPKFGKALKRVSGLS